MDEIYLSRKASKVLKTLLNREGDKRGNKTIPEEEYRNFKDEIRELIEASLIKITWLPQIYETENRKYKIQITNDGKQYFNKKRYINCKFWIPLFIGWCLGMTPTIIKYLF